MFTPQFVEPGDIVAKFGIVATVGQKTNGKWIIQFVDGESITTQEFDSSDEFEVWE